MSPAGPAAAATALALALAAGNAAAGPALDVVACRFSADALAAALARELAAAGPRAVGTPATVVTCAVDGTARLAIAATPPIAVDVDLADVPDELAPRVVAVLLAAALVAPAAATASAPAPTPSPVAPTMLTTAPPVGDRVTAPGHPRRPTLIGDRRWRLGLGARAASRFYRGGPGPLWGIGVGALLGPVAIGAVHLRANDDHALGELATTITAVDVAVTVACARAEITTCIGARTEAGRGAIAAAAADPGVTGGEVAALELHVALELTVARELRGVEEAGALAAGAGAGVVARANGVEAASLAGWSLGAALEVRR